MTRATISDTLRRRLRELRVDAGLRQDDVAAALGRSKALVSRYESGDVPIPIESLEILADLLRVRWVLIETGHDAPDLGAITERQAEALASVLEVLPRLDDATADQLAAFARFLSRPQ